MLCNIIIVILLFIVSCVLDNFVEKTYKNKPIIEKDKTHKYEDLVFGGKKNMCDEKTKEVLKDAYELKKHTENISHKYLMFFWAVESVLLLIAVETLRSTEITLTIRLFILFFVCLFGIFFSSYYASLIYRKDLNISNIKIHIMFLERNLDRKLESVFLSTTETDTSKTHSLDISLLPINLLLFWEFAISILLLAFIIFESKNTLLNPIFLLKSIFLFFIYFLSINNVVTILSFEKNEYLQNKIEGNIVAILPKEAEDEED